MIVRAKRWLGAHAWGLTGRVERNAQELYGGENGLRILAFHGTGPSELPKFQRIVEWCGENIGFATPADADEIAGGTWSHGPRTRVLITFDDGHESNYEAARWLSRIGVAALFFVVPSFVGRTVGEFVTFHRARGIVAYPFAEASTRGLSTTQLREMRAMGHRIGAHNFAHRDLGRVSSGPDLAYEIDRALEGIAELTGMPCRDFALAFGQPENLSKEAAELLLAQGLRVYACHRGLNVPGRTPRFLLRDAVEPNHPFAFTRACLLGGGDHSVADKAERLAARVGLLPRRQPAAEPMVSSEPVPGIAAASVGTRASNSR